MVNTLIIAFALVWVMGCGQPERDPFSAMRSGSVFHLTGDDYCTVQDPAGKPRMQVPCSNLQDFLHADSLSCRQAQTQAFVPWSATFPGGGRKIRLCRNDHRPERQQKDRIRFLVFGDAGQGNDVSQGYAQSRVAATMRNLCEYEPCDFAVVVGDLIYPAGVSDVFDPALDSRFEDIYRDFGAFDFYLVPGNHDHLGNIQAEVEYSYFSDRWRMLDQHFSIPDLPPWLTIYGIDSSPMVDGMSSKSRREQETSLNQNLCHRDGWRIIFGHHPPVSHGEHGDSLPIAKILQSWSNTCPFHLYMAGHDHHQEYLSTNLFDILLQGAGGAAARKVTVNAPPRAWGDQAGMVEQRFARSEHGFAMVDVTPKTMTVAYYSIKTWDFEAAEPLGLVQESDAIFRCRWQFGLAGGCKTVPN